MDYCHNYMTTQIYDFHNILIHNTFSSSPCFRKFVEFATEARTGAHNIAVTKLNIAIQQISSIV